MKQYIPDTPRTACAVAAVVIAVTTLIGLVGVPMLMDVSTATLSVARGQGAIVVQHARNDLRVAGEMYASANTVPTYAVR